MLDEEEQESIWAPFGPSSCIIPRMYNTRTMPSIKGKVRQTDRIEVGEMTRNETVAASHTAPDRSEERAKQVMYTISVERWNSQLILNQFSTPRVLFSEPVLSMELVLMISAAQGNLTTAH
jgi:hypothetical protein